MQISDKGLEALIAEEGEVLRAYRDVAGIWTIGVGLTAASGVVKPVSGMVITKEESRRLLREALARSYEPQVEVAMSITDGAVVKRPAQHEFDAGVSFHFNTGAIAKASWIQLWKSGASPTAITAAMMQWRKAGWRVLPALENRREREAQMLLYAKYRGATAQNAPSTAPQWSLSLSAAEQTQVRDALAKLGYIAPGAYLTKTAVCNFQIDHRLTVDGIIGRATLSTIERALAVKTKAVAPTVAVAGLAISAATGAIDAASATAHVDTAALLAAGAWFIGHLWRYRDVLLRKSNIPPLGH